MFRRIIVFLIICCVIVLILGSTVFDFKIKPEYLTYYPDAVSISKLNNLADVELDSSMSASDVGQYLETSPSGGEINNEIILVKFDIIDNELNLIFENDKLKAGFIRKE